MNRYVQDTDFTLYVGDVREVLAELPAASVDCVVTSPPYWGLRDYGHDGQIGLESSPAEYVEQMGAVFAEIHRVLADSGTLWLNLGDTYSSDPKKGGSGTPNGRNGRGEGYARSKRLERGAGRWGGGNAHAPELKPKDLCGIPWRVAFALQDDGWYLRSDIIWHKPNPMPESVTDRPTKAHEYLFLLTKQPHYFYDRDAIAEPATWYGPNGNPKSGPHAGQMGARAAAKRPQQRRAAELAEQHGLTEAHFDAIRSVGISDTGKALTTTDGAGHNDPEKQRLADEAKVALGGYYREFLIPLTRNARSVWPIPTMQYADAHFATFPEELPRRCILAGCPEQVCATCGKPVAADVIRSPLASGTADDPTMLTGRKGMNRTRREGEGVREITRVDQVAYAEQLRESPHREQMEAEVGATAFAHYIRTDKSGARPVPADVLGRWIAAGLIAGVQSGAATCCDGRTRPGVVLDPFMGSGTTAKVARDLGRKSIGIELNAEYADLAARRLQQLSLLADV